MENRAHFMDRVEDTAVAAGEAVMDNQAARGREVALTLVRGKKTGMVVGVRVQLVRRGRGRGLTQLRLPL